LKNITRSPFDYEFPG